MSAHLLLSAQACRAHELVGNFTGALHPLEGAAKLTWTHLHRTSPTRLLNSPSRSSALGGRAGSYPGFGSWDQGYNNPGGKETQWQTLLLRNEERQRELFLACRAHKYNFYYKFLHYNSTLPLMV